MDISSLLSPPDPPNGSSGPPKTSKRVQMAPSPLKQSTIASSSLSQEPLASLAPLPVAGPRKLSVPVSTLSPIRGLLPQGAGTPPVVDHHVNRQLPPSGMDTLADIATMQHKQTVVRRNVRGPATVEGYEGQHVSSKLYPTQNTMSHKTPEPPVALDEGTWIRRFEEARKSVHSIEERITVMELFQKAVTEEVGSAVLWLAFGEWMLYLYRGAHGEEDDWTEEDRMVGREVISWEMALDTWRSGARATAFRINDSNLIWDRYMDIKLQDLDKEPVQEKVEQIKYDFQMRLQTPHATWNNTFQLFSTFITKYDNRFYEQLMVETNKKAIDAKAKYAARETMEINLQRAVESGDEEAEYKAFTDYLEWEQSGNRKRNRVYNVDLVNALFERAVLRFPKDQSLWLDYLDFVTKVSRNVKPPVDALSVLERSINHCPGSADLWEQYILFLEDDQRTHQEIEEIKHKATSSGELEKGVNGLDAVIKVHTAWCNYLRRRAFRRDGEDDDMDVAEMGIRASMEDVQSLGEKIYKENGWGKYPGDPKYRLEQIYIKFLSQRGSWDSARQIWKNLVPKWGDSYLFWLDFYGWEMVTWGKAVTLGQDKNEINSTVARRQPLPSDATGVLKQALKRPNLDWPEKVIELCRQHCENHEDVDEVQLALMQIRQAEKAVLKRRQREGAAAAAAAAVAAAATTTTATTAAVTVTAATAAQTHQLVPPVVTVSQIVPETASTNGKRKRSLEMETTHEGAHKRSRAENSNGAVESEDVTPSVPVKRDRENATVFVRNLPVDAEERRVKQFFRDCGQIKSFKLVEESDHKSSTATIEFDCAEDALAARTRDLKTFGDREIEVQIGTGSTLYVTNYEPEADEEYIRNLFSPYGRIVDVRFPSLKYNTHRRFCYVQYESSEEAQAASKSLDGRRITPKLQLIAKISDPSRKQGRTGALEEGREIFISNLDRAATEAEVKELFASFGSIERIRIPTNMSGKSKGFCFVTFASKNEATAALSMNNTSFKTRVLNVAVAQPKGAKRATTVVGDNPLAPCPTSDPTSGDGHQDDPSSNQSTKASVPSSAEISARTLALMNIPDTVNVSRIRVICEPFGDLVKVSLRPDHQGATVEFKDANMAGKASLALTGYEIAPGRKIEVGTVQDMLRWKDEKRNDRSSTSKSQGAFADAKSKQFALSQSIRRPTQASSGMRGRRGGLGNRRFVSTLETKMRADEEKKEDEVHDEAKDRIKPKSNDDFKAMFLKSESKTTDKSV